MGNVTKVACRRFQVGWKYTHIHLKEKNDGGYFLEVAVQYPKKLHNLHNDLPFLPERMKIQVFHGNCLRIFLVKTNMLYTWKN